MSNFDHDSNTIHVRRKPQESTYPRIKPTPQNSKISSAFFYSPSKDGTDENLLVLLHGLGDTHGPFAKLGLQLKLPQTAILALRAPDQVPFLDEPSFQWYPSFSPLGELLDNPNPSPALDLLSQVLGYLTDHGEGGCKWPADRIHLFGFAQGGSVALEAGLRWWKSKSNVNSQSYATSSGLGSIVSISGPLLSYPTLNSSSADARCPTPVLLVHRPPQAEDALPAGSVAAVKKGYRDVSESKLLKSGMPSSKEEWEPIMRFWSQRLSRREVETEGENVFQVIGGGL